MTKTLFTLAATFVAVPAIAHDGMHMHPHGYETVLGAALAVGSIVVLLRAFKR